MEQELAEHDSELIVLWLHHMSVSLRLAHTAHRLQIRAGHVNPGWLGDDSYHAAVGSLGSNGTHAQSIRDGRWPRRFLARNKLVFFVIVETFLNILEI